MSSLSWTSQKVTFTPTKLVRVMSQHLLNTILLSIGLGQETSSIGSPGQRSFNVSPAVYFATVVRYPTVPKPFTCICKSVTVLGCLHLPWTGSVSKAYEKCSRGVSSIGERLRGTIGTQQTVNRTRKIVLACLSVPTNSISKPGSQ